MDPVRSYKKPVFDDLKIELNDEHLNVAECALIHIKTLGSPKERGRNIFKSLSKNKWHEVTIEGKRILVKIQDIAAALGVKPMEAKRRLQDPGDSIERICEDICQKSLERRPSGSPKSPTRIRKSPDSEEERLQESLSEKGIFPWQVEIFQEYARELIKTEIHKETDIPAEEVEGRGVEDVRITVTPEGKIIFRGKDWMLELDIEI